MPHQKLIDSLLRPYTVPSFAEAFCDGIVPTHRLALSNLPTPIEPFSLPECPEDVALLLKRDDMTGGIELTGNKVRKLEFIMAEALSGRSTRIYTAGGTQSNHVRATVAACAKLGVPVEVFLRKDPHNCNGNIFLDQLFGGVVNEFDLTSWNEMTSNPNWLIDRALTASQGEELVYAIPIGGSTPLGTWGYIEFVDEVSKQLSMSDLNSIVCASGSGGTAAGIGLGVHLYNASKNNNTHVVSYGVCDTPKWFEDKVAFLSRSVCSSVSSAKPFVEMRDARGEGYGQNTVEELEFISRVARESGVAFDTCYSGKALFGFWKDIKKGLFSGKRALYVHTGGGTSLFDKKDRLLQLNPLL